MQSDELCKLTKTSCDHPCACFCWCTPKCVRKVHATVTFFKVCRFFTNKSKTVPQTLWPLGWWSWNELWRVVRGSEWRGCCTWSFGFNFTQTAFWNNKNTSKFKLWISKNRCKMKYWWNKPVWILATLCMYDLQPSSPISPCRLLPAAAQWCRCKPRLWSACQRIAGRSGTTPESAHLCPPELQFQRFSCWWGSGLPNQNTKTK